jgi:hypothetical protein
MTRIRCQSASVLVRTRDSQARGPCARRAGRWTARERRGGRFLAGIYTPIAAYSELDRSPPELLWREVLPVRRLRTHRMTHLPRPRRGRHGARRHRGATRLKAGELLLVQLIGRRRLRCYAMTHHTMGVRATVHRRRRRCCIRRRRGHRRGRWRHLSGRCRVGVSATLCPGWHGNCERCGDHNAVQEMLHVLDPLLQFRITP